MLKPDPHDIVTELPPHPRRWDMLAWVGVLVGAILVCASCAGWFG